MKPDGPIFRHGQRIYYEHTDAAGVVYHANYLKLYEQARTEWLRAAGYDHQAIAERFGVVFAVYRCEISFLKPARLDDLVEVSIVSAVRKRTSVRFGQEIRRAADLLSAAEIVVVCVSDAGGRPKSMPVPGEIAALVGGTPP